MSDIMDIFRPYKVTSKSFDRRQSDRQVTMSMEEYREFVEARLLLGMVVEIYERAPSYDLQRVLKPILGIFEEEEADEDE